MKKTAIILTLALMPMLAVTGEKGDPKKNEKTVAESMSNAQIYSTLWAKYALDDNLNPFDMDIEVENKTIWLKGEVDTEAEKRLAGEIAESMNGINEIKNQLVVNNDGTRGTDDLVANTKKATQETARDVSIETRLAFNRHTMGNDVDVTVEGNKATLTGTVETDKAYAVAETIAQDTTGIESVDNQIKVVAAKGESMSDMVYNEMIRLSNMAEDGWVETKVETELMLSDAVKMDKIDVEVVDGLVILTGDVPTDTQRDLAEKMIQDIAGVKDIENRLSVS